MLHSAWTYEWRQCLLPDQRQLMKTLLFVVCCLLFVVQAECKLTVSSLVLRCTHQTVDCISNHLSITAVRGAGRGYDATGSTVAACNDVNQLGGSNSSSNPHEMDENSLPHTGQSSISGV